MKSEQKNGAIHATAHSSREEHHYLTTYRIISGGSYQRSIGELIPPKDNVLMATLQQ